MYTTECRYTYLLNLLTCLLNLITYYTYLLNLLTKLFFFVFSNIYKCNVKINLIWLDITKTKFGNVYYRESAEILTY